MQAIPEKWNKIKNRNLKCIAKIAQNPGQVSSLVFHNLLFSQYGQ
jgi:hypothetical protein